MFNQLINIFFKTIYVGIAIMYVQYFTSSTIFECYIKKQDELELTNFVVTHTNEYSTDNPACTDNPYPSRNNEIGTETDLPFTDSA